MHHRYILIAIFVAFLWGLAPILLKRLVAKFDKMTILVLDGFLYFFFLLFIGYKYYDKIVKDIPKIDGFDISLMFLTAVITGLLGNLIYMFLLEGHDSYIITALVSISPFFTLILAYYFTTENITMWGAMGTVLIVSGILMISYNDHQYKPEGYLNFL
jgi:drug/metabolite transporter (DMT)-like permease